MRKYRVTPKAKDKSINIIGVPHKEMDILSYFTPD